MNDFINSTHFLSAGDQFQKELCEFYCQLEFWRAEAIKCGLDLPEINRQDRGMTSQEQWMTALSERDRLGEIWRVEASIQGVTLTQTVSRENTYGNTGGEASSLVDLFAEPV